MVMTSSLTPPDMEQEFMNFAYIFCINTPDPPPPQKKKNE